MLTLTDQAQLVLRKLPRQYADPTAAGLRIALAPGHGDRLHVGSVAAPQPEDRVLEFAGARVFLGPVAARELEGTQLDVELDDAGRLQFRTRAVAG